MPDILTTHFLSAGVFVNLALLCYVCGFLARDQLWLRGWLLTGTAFYLLYYYYASATPLWDAIFASLVLGAANLYMIVVILIERSTVLMREGEAELYRSFHTLSPGQFRRVMAIGRAETLVAERELVRVGVVSDVLVFVVAGNVTIRREATLAVLDPPSFVGEVGFLLQRPATATVVAAAETRVVTWDAADLRALMARHADLSNALVALFNLDLARKVARSMPDAPAAVGGASGG